MQAAVLDRTFHALSDPTRRAMVQRLSRGPASVSELARPLAISLPAVMQHLQVLEASGIVRTPRIPGSDVRRTDIHIAPRPEGGFTGKATLNFRGDLGSYFIRQAQTARKEDFEGDAESMVRARLPGSEVKFTGSSRVEGDVPDMTLTACI